MESKAVRWSLFSIISALSVCGILNAFTDVIGIGLSIQNKLIIFGFTILFTAFWSTMFRFPKSLFIGIPLIAGVTGVVVWKYQEILQLLTVDVDVASLNSDAAINRFFITYLQSPEYESQRVLQLIILSFALCIVMSFFVAKLQSCAILFLTSASFMVASVYPQMLSKLSDLIFPTFLEYHRSIFSFILLLLCNIALIAFNIYEKMEFPEIHREVIKSRRFLEILVLTAAVIFVALIILKYVIMAYILYYATIFIIFFILIVIL
jgi:hypothetical protein